MLPHIKNKCKKPIHSFIDPSFILLNMNENRETTLKNENIVWLLYLCFAIAGIHSNNLELEDIKNHNDNNKKKYKTINVIILIIALFIYIYFINLTYKRYNKNHKKEDLLTSIAATLVFIAGLIFLYVELTGDEVVPNEV